MAVQHTDETSMLIIVRLLSDPNFSNQTMPRRAGRRKRRDDEQKMSDIVLNGLFWSKSWKK